MAGSPYKRVFHWYAWQPLPWLKRFLFQNPLWAPILPNRPSTWVTFATHLVETRLAKPAVADDGSRHDLLQKYLDASAVNPGATPPATLRGLVTSTISAGSDTTAGTLTAALYLILHHPTAYEKLMREFTAAEITLR